MSTLANVSTSLPAYLPGLFVLAAAGVFLVAAVMTPLARRAALWLDFVDHPGGRKTHARVMPYGGGTAILLAAWPALAGLLVLAWTLPDDWLVARFGETLRDYVGGARDNTRMLLTILGGGLALHLLGLLDDRRPQPPLLKLGVIVAVALLVGVAGNVRLGLFLGEIGALLATTAWFIIIVNAFNFLDNMDGLSAGVAALCLAALAVCGALAGQVLVPLLACIFFGAVTGFLWFNFPPARIFMGDAGSLLVGYMLAVVSTMTTYYDSTTGMPPYTLAMPFVILAIPLYDFISVVVIRLLEGRNPMVGDQRHFSHRLVERGLTRRFAVLTIYLATATTGLGATLLPGADLLRTVTIVVMVLMVLGIIAILEAPLRPNT
ncbi:MAG: undecaprenyl/decaprenyl-phosphate alpha-N-acetylglucosaminyl 1-phosphate transferase [Phycisphaerales bacterium]|nr:undecaprenyl/decaprenyl-phosphate alpha-N-acetylglucosaminyl 1-phosphate transferase [Phycisphaerales bacterium]